jgi:hypothetical protein
MAKPKVVRNSEWEYNQSDEWVKWLADNEITTDEYDLSNKVVKEVAVATGQTPDEVLAERRELYNSYRAMFEGHIEGMRESKETENLVRNNTLDSFASIYQRADRILTGLNVLVSVSETEVAPAYNDGKDIVFSGKLIKEVDDKTILSLHGLNYHELGHLLFTPRIGTALGKWVTETKMTSATNTWKSYDGTEHTNTWEVEELVEPARQMAFNILEDCRQEYFLTQRYPSVRPFMVALLGDYIADKPEELGDQFVLLAGRKYFSLEVRKLSAQMSIEKRGLDFTKSLYSIINEYRTLVFPRQYDRAKELITDLISLLPKDEKGCPKPVGDNPNGCMGRPIMRNGRVATEKEQDGLLGNHPDGKGGEPDEDLFEGLREPSLSAGNEASDETAEVNTETADFNNKVSEVIEVLQKTIERAKADKLLQKKVRETVNAIIRDRSVKSILGKTTYQLFSPELNEVTSSRLFAQELERLRIDSDPAWEREKPSGKLNVKRAMNADINQIDKLFDRWQEGNDDYDIEACILIDKSGSMWSEIGSACRSAWVIKRAIERIDGKVSAMTFSDTARELFDRDTKASGGEVRVVSSSGGTNPYYALKETERIMGNSNAKTKLVFILTDGSWWGNNDQIIENMKRQGTYVSVVWLGSEDYAKQILNNPSELEQYTHKANDFRTITKPNELVKVAKDVVKHHIKTGVSRG